MGRGKLLFVRAPPALTETERDAFYGRETETKKMRENVLDSDKLERLAGDADGDGIGNENEEDEEEVVDEEEFLSLWQHPLSEYADADGMPSKKKRGKSA